LAPRKAAASGLAGRYATALFDLASEKGELEAVEADLGRLEGALHESPDLGRALRSPVVSREQHEQTLAALAQRIGFAEVTRHFLGLLAEKRRLTALASIAAQFRMLLAESRGEETAEVVSAVPLDEEDLGRLRESVGKYAGRAVSLTSRVDPGLLGGLVVRIGSRMIDASLKTKLHQLELSMRGIR
jgi:F-type H+-transporting ATPase subunit delta